MTSKISQNAANAFIAGRSFGEGNTSVIVDHSGTGTVTMTLHGNPIARYSGDNETTEISLAGYPTATTRARINTLLKSMQGNYYRGICQRNHEQMLVRFDGQGTNIHSRGWYRVK